MKIWYDISGIFHWKGNFTGIQRVVYNLGKELDAAKDAETGFFTYHGGYFNEVSFADLEQRLAELNQTASRSSKKERLTVAKLHHHGMVALKKVAKRTPLEKPLRYAYHGARSSYRSIRSGSVQTVATLTHPFKEGDVVMVVDGNWQFPGYAEAMRAAKAKTRFTFLHFVHDMVAVRNPALANPGAEKIIGGYFKKVFAYADGLIAISESTKRDIRWYTEKIKLNRELPIYSIRLGDNIASEKITPKAPVLPFDEPFIVAVSTVEIRKNYTLLYYVYKLALERGVELPQLVIVGRKGWLAEEAYTLLTEDPDVNSRVTILQKANDQELEWLYQNCLFTVFPSFYEGWGLPIAESLEHGKACISSHASSMPEVGDELVDYVSPYDPAAMVKAIKVMSNPENRKKQEVAIRQNYVTRSWQVSCNDLLKVVNSL